MKRTFDATFCVRVTIDERVFKATLTDEWRAAMYPFTTREQVANHIAFNLMQGSDLNHIDGYANLPKEWAKLVHTDGDNVVEVRTK